MTIRLAGLALFSLWLAVGLWLDYYRGRSIPLAFLLVGILLALITRWLGWQDPWGALLMLLWITATYGRAWTAVALISSAAWMMAHPDSPFRWVLPIAFFLTCVLWAVRTLGNADYIAAVLLLGLAGDDRMPLLLAAGTIVWSLVLILRRHGLRGSLGRIREVAARLRQNLRAGDQDPGGIRSPWFLVPALAGWVYFWIWPGEGLL